MQTSYVVLKRFLITIAEVYLDKGDIAVFDSASGTLTVYRNQAVVKVVKNQTQVGIEACVRTGLLAHSAPAPAAPVEKPVVTNPTPAAAPTTAPVVEEKKAPVVEEPKVAPVVEDTKPTEEPKAEEKVEPEEAKTEDKSEQTGSEPESQLPAHLEGKSKEELIAYAKETLNLNIHPATGPAKVVAKILSAEAANAAESEVTEAPATEEAAKTEETPAAA